MFKVKILQSHYNAANRQAASKMFRSWLYLNLPFPPMLGLKVGLEQGGFAELKSVYWNVKEGYFECLCEDEYLESGFDHEFQMLPELGWSLSLIVDARLS